MGIGTFTVRLALVAGVSLGVMLTPGDAYADPKPKPILPVRRDPPPSASDDAESGASSSGTTTKMPTAAKDDKSSDNKPAGGGGGGEKSDKDKPSKDGFPMAADDFQSQMDAKVEKAKEKLAKLTAKMDASTAEALRKKFGRAVAAMQKELAKATADGTVTRHEAERVAHAFQAGAHARRPR